MKNIIVTGGAGFIGSQLAEALIEQGNKVTVIDDLSTGKKDNLQKVIDNIEFIECDISDYQELSKKTKHLNNISYIYHLAALARIGRSIDEPLETHKANVTGTLSLLELARKLNVERFIFASSSSVYGIQDKLPLTEDLFPNPQNPYATQKLMGELYCETYGKVFNLKSTAFRFFNVYGTGMSTEGAYKLVFSIWLEQLKKGDPLTIYGDGKQTRDFTHVSDVVRGLIASMNYDQKENFELFNLGAGRQIEVNYLAELFGSEVVHLPERGNDERFKEADISKAKSHLGWEPKVSIEDGVKELLK